VNLWPSSVAGSRRERKEMRWIETPMTVMRGSLAWLTSAA